MREGGTCFPFLLSQKSDEDVFYIVQTEKIISDVVFGFCFINMAIKMGNKASLKEMREIIFCWPHKKSYLCQLLS